MFNLRVTVLEEYLSCIFGSRVKIVRIGELDGSLEGMKNELKGFGYGVPYIIEVKIYGTEKKLVLETIRSGGFGHEHFSDRAQILLWQNSAFNKLPRHARSVDVGAFTVNGGMKSVGDCKEFFIITEFVEGKPYYLDLDRISLEKQLIDLDVKRCKVLSDYAIQIHADKKDDRGLYIKRIRDLIGHGEGIMGLTDSYPSNLDYITDEDLCEVEKGCTEWRWKLKKGAHRCSCVHGDFHPWNILFREDVDFTVLDRSRGEWGEPADDLTAMTINYLFYSLRTYGKLQGPFKILFDGFWKNYLDKTEDDEMLSFVQPFYAWRGLVLASPLWYPDLSTDTRVKLFNFIKNILSVDKIDLKDINSYIET